MHGWLRLRFGPRWHMYVSNALWSTTFLVTMCIAHVFWLAVVAAAFWGMCVTNAFLLFVIRRDAEREGMLDDLDAMREAQ